MCIHFNPHVLEHSNPLQHMWIEMNTCASKQSLKWYILEKKDMLDLRRLQILKHCFSVTSELIPRSSVSQSNSSEDLFRPVQVRKNIMHNHKIVHLAATLSCHHSHLIIKHLQKKKLTDEDNIMELREQT
jgi:hypothetical protein